MTPIIRDDKLILTTTQMFGTETQYSEDKAYEVDTIATPNGVRDIANNTMNKLDKVLIVEEYTSHTSSEEDVVNEKVEQFKTEHSTALALTVGTVEAENEGVVNAALAGYDALVDEAVKTKLSAEKNIVR